MNVRRLVLVLGMLATVACASADGSGRAAPDPAQSIGTAPSSPSATASAPPPLAALRIDDRPHTEGYRRSEWPTWKDIDGDGCDARSQALIAASDPPAVLRGQCDVVSGTWRSAA